MAQLLFSRLLQLAGVLLALSLLTFGLMKLAPGDPVASILRPDEVSITAADEAALRSTLGLDLPLHEQYLRWMTKVARLDLGHSYVSQRPVVDELLRRLPATLFLAGGGLAVMAVVALPLGLLAALYHNRLPDHLSRVLGLIGASMPNFWLGLLLIYFFAYKLGWLPSMGTGSWSHLLLPSVTLGFSMAAVYARLLRTGLLESLQQEYVRAARARGLREGRIVLRHALRAALLPVLTLFGMSFGSLLGGAVVVEILFSWPGLGKMAIDAIFQRDYPVIQGYVMLTGTFVLIANLLVDIGYRTLDPRIRLERGSLR